MRHTQPDATSKATPAGARLIVTRTPDGRFCIVYTNGATSRRSYTPLLEQVVRQAQRGVGIPVHTEDDALRQHFQDVGVALI